jgi:hypothetical protein
MKPGGCGSSAPRYRGGCGLLGTGIGGLQARGCRKAALPISGGLVGARGLAASAAGSLLRPWGLGVRARGLAASSCGCGFRPRGLGLRPQFQAAAFRKDKKKQENNWRGEHSQKEILLLLWFKIHQYTLPITLTSIWLSILLWKSLTSFHSRYQLE